MCLINWHFYGKNVVALELLTTTILGNILKGILGNNMFQSKSVHTVTFQLTFCDNSVITVVALKSNSRGQLSSVDTSDSRLSQPLFVRW